MDSGHPACKGQSWNLDLIPLSPNTCHFLYSMSFQAMAGKDRFQVTEGQVLHVYHFQLGNGAQNLRILSALFLCLR